MSLRQLDRWTRADLLPPPRRTPTLTDTQSRRRECPAPSEPRRGLDPGGRVVECPDPARGIASDTHRIRRARQRRERWRARDLCRRPRTDAGRGICRAHHLTMPVDRHTELSRRTRELKPLAPGQRSSIPPNPRKRRARRRTTQAQAHHHDQNQAQNQADAHLNHHQRASLRKVAYTVSRTIHVHIHKRGNRLDAL